VGLDEQGGTYSQLCPLIKNQELVETKKKFRTTYKNKLKIYYKVVQIRGLGAL
jgi:hypothetical protein